MLQLLARGIANAERDSLSEDSWREMVASVTANSVDLHRMSPADECGVLIEHALALPQRAPPLQ